MLSQTDISRFWQRVRYGPFLAHLIITRRCNLCCKYCNEYDNFSKPVPAEILIRRLEVLKQLGTVGICLTGGEPTIHPDLSQVIRACRELKFFRTGMITNGLLLTPGLIGELNESGLQELQVSVDGVKDSESTEKVLSKLRKHLHWLRDYAKFKIAVCGVIGICSAEETFEVLSYAKALGFVPRVLLMHDHNGQLNLTVDSLRAFINITSEIPRTVRDISNYADKLVRRGKAPFKCRAGSRYLYIDENGLVSWCSQTRQHWSKPLVDYTYDDLRKQFYDHKACQDTCTLGCVRSVSQFDSWRPQKKASETK